MLQAGNRPNVTEQTGSCTFETVSERFEKLVSIQGQRKVAKTCPLKGLFMGSSRSLYLPKFVNPFPSSFIDRTPPPSLGDSARPLL